ncbi:winged helix DNA-binding protein [Agrobacterium salinitolerans]|nr:winged helix DNA-binding protein [Agrobacterium salinitolerans]
MTQRSRSKDWSEFLVVADRILRVFNEFISPVLVKHEAESISLANILFLISMGEGEFKVSEIVRKGRYVGSNATYAIKALTAAGLITRRQDVNDRRNALISWTTEGAALVRDIKTNSTDTTGYCRDSWETLAALENHCARRVVA